VPRSVVLIFWAFAVLYLGGSRFLVRRYLAWSLRGHLNRVPIAIFGAGGCGLQLASGLSEASVYLPQVFVDDDARLHGTLIHGVRVIGRDKLKDTLARYHIKTVVLAIPSASRDRRKDVVSFLEMLNVQVMSVPALSEVVAGRARIEDVHDVD